MEERGSACERWRADKHVAFKRLKKINLSFRSHLSNTYNCVQDEPQMHAPSRFNHSTCHYDSNAQWIMELMMRSCKGTSNFYCLGDEGTKESLKSAKMERRKRSGRGVNNMSSIIWLPAVSPPPEPALIDLLTRTQNPQIAENMSYRKEC